MSNPEDFALICSVGGSAEPVRKSIDHHKPRHVIYVASASSRKTIRQEIENMLEWHGIEDTHSITLSNFQDLLACVQDIRQGIAQGLEAMGLPENSLLVADITGGTKVMSAALTLVMMEYNSRFAYVGGDTRSKNGLGVVLPGHETIMRQDNPWEILALREVRDLASAFNSYEFTVANSIASQLGSKVPGKEKFYAGIADLVYAYSLWDTFDHKGALARMRQAIGRLEPFTVNSLLFLKLLDSVRGSLVLLEKIQQDAQFLRAAKPKLPQQCGHSYLCDLISNAIRRAKAGRYDDAVARLYSAIEKSAKIRLLSAYDIDNSHILPDKLPEQLPKELRSELLAMQSADGVIRIGLQKSFYLLAALSDPLGRAYEIHESTLQKSLEVRNLSLLAHGYNPVNEKTYNDFLAVALHFLEVTLDDLPKFPYMDWKSLLL